MVSLPRQCSGTSKRFAIISCLLRRRILICYEEVAEIKCSADYRWDYDIRSKVSDYRVKLADQRERRRRGRLRQCCYSFCLSSNFASAQPFVSPVSFSGEPSQKHHQFQRRSCGQN